MLHISFLWATATPAQIPFVGVGFNQLNEGNAGWTVTDNSDNTGEIIPFDTDGLTASGNSGLPVLAPQPGAGVDCTDPPNLLPGAQLQNCPLSMADLSGFDLSGANLQGADLRSAKLTDTILFGADLRNANLDCLRSSFNNLCLGPAVDLAGAVLDGADLRGANLTGAQLLPSVTMTSADLRGANLRFAKWCNGGQPIFGGTTCPDGTNSNDPDNDGFTCILNGPFFPAGNPLSCLSPRAVRNQQRQR